jgi:hypothetical protein
MSERSRRLAALALLVVLGCLAASGAAAARPGATGPLHLTAAFDRNARLGSPTAVDVDLRLDAKRFSTAQLTEVRFEYPRDLGVVSSGLGLAACTRPASDFAKVLIPDQGLAGCSPNAVMGYGIARAIIRLTNGQVIPEFATVTLLSGPLEHGRLGLVVYVDGVRPFGAKLAFAGDVRDARAPYGGELAVRMPVIPGLEDLAVVSLVEMRITIASHAIRYTERRHGRLVSYRPDGIELPTRCPRGGFRFRAGVGFADGTRHSVVAAAPCPSAVAAPSGGR